MLAQLFALTSRIRPRSGVARCLRRGRGCQAAEAARGWPASAGWRADGVCREEDARATGARPARSPLAARRRSQGPYRYRPGLVDSVGDDQFPLRQRASTPPCARWVAAEQHPVPLDRLSVYLIMPPRWCGRPGWPPLRPGAVPLDEPGAVVAVDEAGHGLAEFFHGVVQLDPQVLFLEGADPALGAAVGRRLAQERRVVADAQPGQRAGEWTERYWAPQSCRSWRPRAMSASSRPKRSMTAS
jgi:hypothetical protein